MSFNGGSPRTEKAMLARTVDRPLTFIETRQGTLKEYFLSFQPERDHTTGDAETPGAFYDRVARFVKEIEGAIVQERCYGATDSYARIVSARERAYERYGVDGEGTLCFVGQTPCESPEVGGLHLWIACTKETQNRCGVTHLVRDGRSIGRRYSLNGISFLSVPSVGPRSELGESANLEERAVSMFEEVNRILRDDRLTYLDVARTWIYLPKLLSWYGKFNTARRKVFSESGLLDGGDMPVWLPASTGIQGACPQGRDCMMDFLAVARPEGSDVTMEMVESPDQCEALNYGSCFARAVEILDSSLSRFYISGTASIAAGGETIHVGDCENQSRHTLKVVADLLGARGHDFSDLGQAVVFLKRPEYLKEWRRVAQEAGLDPRGVIEVTADVCRDDLLIELEIMTVKAVGVSAAGTREEAAGALK